MTQMVLLATGLALLCSNVLPLIGNCLHGIVLFLITLHIHDVITAIVLLHNPDISIENQGLLCCLVVIATSP